jgi:hypothetical protein
MGLSICFVPFGLQGLGHPFGRDGGLLDLAAREAGQDRAVPEVLAPSAQRRTGIAVFATGRREDRYPGIEYGFLDVDRGRRDARTDRFGTPIPSSILHLRRLFPTSGELVPNFRLFSGRGFGIVACKGEDFDRGRVNVVRLLRTLKLGEILHRAIGFAVNVITADVPGGLDLGKQFAGVDIVGGQDTHFQVERRPEKHSLVVALVPYADEQQPRERR